MTRLQAQKTEGGSCSSFAGKRVTLTPASKARAASVLPYLETPGTGRVSVAVLWPLTDPANPPSL